MVFWKSSALSVTQDFTSAFLGLQLAIARPAIARINNSFFIL
jgi:hypothetical protein